MLHFFQSLSFVKKQRGKTIESFQSYDFTRGFNRRARNKRQSENDRVTEMTDLESRVENEVNPERRQIRGN